MLRSDFEAHGKAQRLECEEFNSSCSWVLPIVRIFFGIVSNTSKMTFKLIMKDNHHHVYEF